MKLGDLVVGRSVDRFGFKIEPIPDAIGVVVDLNPAVETAHVLYNEQIYIYFQSTLQVLNETDGENQDRLLQG